MNVIPFPSRGRPRHAADALELAYGLIAGLRFLGEPATAGEILRFLKGISLIAPDLTEAGLVAVLDAHAETGLPGMERVPVFRCVTLRCATAWAFTPAFRTTLHWAGLPAVLRAGAWRNA